MNEKKYSEEEITYILCEYKKGVSFNKIGKDLKKQKNNIKNILIEMGVFNPEKNKIIKEFTINQIRDIKNLYLSGLNCEKIGIKYGVSKTPIKRILKTHGILKKGNSDGKKIILNIEDEEKIKNLYLKKYKSSDEIAKELGLTKSFIDKFLSKSNFRRNKSMGVSVGLVKRYRNINYDEYMNISNEYKKYKNDVMRITRQQPIKELKNYNKRGNSGTKGAYHLDHKFSILEAFKDRVSPEIIGNISNLEFIPWEENIKKRTKCSITIKELIK